MPSRRLFPLAVAGATLVAGVAFAAPASASVTYDPTTNRGFVGAPDVRKAFGWTVATLSARAPGVVFDHDFWTDDTYTVSCGGLAFPVVHHAVYGRFQLARTVTRDLRRGAPTGYDGRLIGFRLTGARFGISGTSVPPAAGQPCPRDEAPGALIRTARKVSTATGWALLATYADVRHRLAAGGPPRR